MVEYRLKIPDQLDRIFSLPVLLYRLLRYGYVYRRIPLTQGKYARVDVDNFYRFLKYNWHAHYDGNCWYAIRVQRINGKVVEIPMHRAVLNAPKGMFVDHIDGDGLNNCRANLRLATSSQNCCNRRTKPSPTSKYKGVFYIASEGCYRVCISKNGKRISVGRFKSEIEAARTYDTAALKYHKEFAKLNFPAKKKINWFWFIKKLRKIPPAKNKQSFPKGY